MSVRQRTSIEAMAEARCIVGALLPLEGNDKPLVVNVYLSQTCDVMDSTKEDESPPVSFWAPRVMQARRTRKGMNH